MLQHTLFTKWVCRRLAESENPTTTQQNIKKCFSYVALYWDCITISKSVNPCGNFSDTSSLKFLKSKGSIGPVTPCSFKQGPTIPQAVPFTPQRAMLLVSWLFGSRCSLGTTDRHLVCELHPWKGALNSRFHEREARLL